MLTQPHPTHPVIRDVTFDDVATVVELWREFEEEMPELAWRVDEAEIHLRELERAIGTDIVLLAEQDARPVGLAVADTKGKRLGFLHVLYVHPSARQLGVAAALVRATVDRLRTQGCEMLELEVLASNGRARSVYERWGFEPAELTLAAKIDTLVERLAVAQQDSESVVPQTEPPDIRLARLQTCRHSATFFEERHSRTKAIARACSPIPTHSNSPLVQLRRAESVSLPSIIESSASRRWPWRDGSVNSRTSSSTQIGGGAALPPRSCSTP